MNECPVSVQPTRMGVRTRARIVCWFPAGFHSAACILPHSAFRAAAQRSRGPGQIHRLNEFVFGKREGYRFRERMRGI